MATKPTTKKAVTKKAPAKKVGNSKPASKVSKPAKKAAK